MIRRTTLYNQILCRFLGDLSKLIHFPFSTIINQYTLNTLNHCCFTFKQDVISFNHYTLIQQHSKQVWILILNQPSSQLKHSKQVWNLILNQPSSQSIKG